MKTTERFENAVTKLYKAFHEGTLDAMDCKHCAVGNIIGHDSWSCGSGAYYFTTTKPIAQKFYLNGLNNSGYNERELSKIEMNFILGVGYNGYFHEKNNKDFHFNGLCAVIEYLAELDNIPNPMDYSKLFETENEKPKYELSF